MLQSTVSWDNKKQYFNTFNSLFNGHLSCIHEANMDFTLQALKMCWIRALPEPFIKPNSLKAPNFQINGSPPLQ